MRPTIDKATPVQPAAPTRTVHLPARERGAGGPAM